MSLTTSKTDPLSSVSPFADPFAFSIDDLLASKSPEIQMLKSLLARAIDDVLTTATMISLKDRRNARSWIFSDAERSDKDLRFTFVEVCEHLDLDPGRIRKHILKAEKAITNFSFNESQVSELFSYHRDNKVSLRRRMCDPLLRKSQVKQNS